ncbi:hypothetical protein [Beihai hepe-like virus 9]|uniref:hypothetical protein n=1 Tax=Beihai hepe-like virus 9 TaxID=1922386 RepID=UPI00090B56EF|nr:hypothetical protein [Beihai hepe-like virus 9]APG77630.1 hypothetical protein [Beihai hepe-like virus 9]
MTHILAFRVSNFVFQVEFDYDDAPLEARKQLISLGNPKGRGIPEPLHVVEYSRFEGGKVIEVEPNYILYHKQPLHPFFVSKFRNRLNFVRVISNCSQQSHIPESFYTNFISNWQMQ